MVPVIAPSHIEARAALRARATESCRRDLSKVFLAWLLQQSDQHAEFVSISAQAATRVGADQDFQTVAILGFAADAGLISEVQLAALKRGLNRLAGRSPVVNGVPMAFCADAVGILGVALGTAVVADAEVTGQVVGWAARFLKASYERGRAEDWQRCLYAAADRKMGSPLRLAIPNCVAAADIRIALLAKGLIGCADTQVRQDMAQTLGIAIGEPQEEPDCERAALRLAAIDWVIRTKTQQGDRLGAALEDAITRPQDTSKNDGDIDTGPRKKRGRPTEIPDERKRRALAARGGKARAKILYQTSYPTPQQVKNVPAILRHYKRTHSSEG